jgi:type I restriction enzyme M protein
LEEIAEMLTSETKNRINACRDVLVGKLPLPTDQVELITLALIYKFMDDLDEESVNVMKGKRSFFTGDLAKYRWRNLLPQTVSAEERMTLFAEGIEALGHAQKAAHLPGLFRDIFRNAFLKFRDGRILTLFLTEVNGFAYSHSEELGNAFEYLLQCMGTQGENGQFRTPRHIIDFIVDCLEPQPGEKILDPACGTGGFLVSAYKHILARHTSPGSTIPGDLLTHAQRQAVYQNLAGYDTTDLMVKLSKVNLFLHGFPDPAIHIYDTLSNDARWHEKADLILANPPFMTPKGGVTPHTKFRIAAKKAEVLFTDYIAEHLTPDGRGGVIVPNGIVATTQNAYVKLRRFLVEDSLVAVVSLPAGVFKPYSGVKTSILLLDKKLARTAKEILFLKITADGFDLGDKRTPIEANDLPEAERVVKLWLAGKPKEGTESAVAWKAVEKKELLAHRSVSLQAEPFFGEKVAASDIESVPLSEVCEFIDYRGKTPEKSEKGVPLVTAKNVRWGVINKEPAEFVTEDTYTKHMTRGFPKRGDVLFTTEAPLGMAALVDSDERFALAQRIICLAPDSERMIGGYLVQALLSHKVQESIHSFASGATAQGIKASSLREIEIPLPPLEEQRRIVAEIEGYQKVLDGARQILAGYKPQIEVNSEWETAAVGDAIETITPPKKILATDFRPEGRFPVIDQSQNAIAGRTDDESTLIDGTSGLVIFGDHTCAVKFVAERFAQGADGIKIIQPKPALLPKFMFYFLLAHPIEADGYKRHFGKLKESEIPLPPLAEQRRIVAELDAEAAQLDSVRALLPRFEAKIQRILDRVWGNGESE